MDLSQLHVFLTVAKEQSFSRAAEKLYRTQPAVSIVIRKLEESVGQPLLVRGARNAEESGAQPLLVRGARQVKLTDAGELLRDYAERLLNLRDEIEKGMEDLKSRGRGELRLGVNESSIHALLPALARYRKLYPGVKLIMHRTLSRDIPQEVLNYRLDLGTVSYVPEDPKLEAVEILQDELTFVVPPKHKLARRRSVDIKELGEETFIAHNVESPYRSRVIQLFEKHRTQLRRDIEMPTIESIKRFVQMGMGVAIVPRMCVRWEVERKQLAEVRIRQLNIPRHVYLVGRRGARLPHAAAELMRILRDGHQLDQ